MIIFNNIVLPNSEQEVLKVRYIIYVFLYDRLHLRLQRQNALKGLLNNRGNLKS